MAANDSLDKFCGVQHRSAACEAAFGPIVPDLTIGAKGDIRQAADPRCDGLGANDFSEIVVQF